MRTLILLIMVLVTNLPTARLASAEYNVRLHGALVALPCVIPPGEENIVLNFGSVITKYLYANGRTKGEKFGIHLTHCDTSIANSVKVMFSGNEDGVLTGLLGLNAGSQAEGVAIGMETESGQFLPLNTPSSYRDINDGDNNLIFKAYVQGYPERVENGNITVGDFVASATFWLYYE